MTGHGETMTSRVNWESMARSLEPMKSMLYCPATAAAAVAAVEAAVDGGDAGRVGDEVAEGSCRPFRPD